MLAVEPADRVLVSTRPASTTSCEAFADVIDAKSPFTARHSRGVATYAGLIGRQLGFGQAQLRELQRAGMLHDIGKLGSRTRSSTNRPAERRRVRRISLHPSYTESILAGIPAFAPSRASPRPTTSVSTAAATTAASRPPACPLSARALAVADVFEALTAERPYRGPMDPAEALAIARKDPGHLDESCVEALAAGVEDVAERFAA